MTNTTKLYRRIAIATAALVGVAAIAYGGWVAWMYHITFASDADCRSAQAVVKAGGNLTDATAAKTWAVSARAQNGKLEHDRLTGGVGRYITLVEQTFSGTQPSAQAKAHAFSDMFDACRDIDVSFPTPS